jgi:hypothetical protein
MRSPRNPLKRSMTAFLKSAWRPGVLLGCVFALAGGSARASVDDAQSFALEAAQPYNKDGFQVREDYWGGDLAPAKKAVRQQSSRETIRFWLGTGRVSKVSVHVYDSDGKLVEQSDGWQKGHSRRRTSSQRTRAAIYYRRDRNRPRNELTGRWLIAPLTGFCTRHLSHLTVPAPIVSSGPLRRL